MAYVVSMLFAMLSAVTLLIELHKLIEFKKNPFVFGDLIQVDLIANESMGLYEATYRYTIGTHTRLYISDRKLKNPRKFKKRIKIYYREDKRNNVFEKPNTEIITVCIISLVCALFAMIVFRFQFL